MKVSDGDRNVNGKNVGCVEVIFLQYVSLLQYSLSLHMFIAICVALTAFICVTNASVTASIYLQTLKLVNYSHICHY